MSASPPQGLFKPAQQGDSLAILVLIENSAAMIDRWPDLRDHYLPTLLGTVRKVNPVVPVRDNTSLSFRLPTERSYLSTPAIRFMHYCRFRLSSSPAAAFLRRKRPSPILVVHASAIYQRSVSATNPTTR